MKYRDAAPWPAEADGAGYSLHRVPLAGYANDPAHWVAQAPTPGPLADADSDADGMPDAWEDAYDLDKNDSADALLDSDGDHFANRAEHMAGTDPRDAASVLKLSMLPAVNGNPKLRFLAVENRSYTIEYTETIPSSDWRLLTIIPTGPARIIELPDIANRGSHFYRVRTP